MAALMSVCGVRFQPSFLRCYLSNPSFTSGVRSVYKLGLYAEDLNCRNKWPLRRNISTKEQNEGEKRIMITLKREETQSQALSELHEKDLIDYFSSYGKIQRVNWIRDRVTNAVKGYGFVTFCDTDSLKEAVSRKRHVLGGRQVDVFPATEREKSSKVQKRKIVVKRQRGHRGDLDLTSVQEYFSKLGDIESVDSRNLQSKGYVHVIFKDEESVERAVLDKQHNINDETVVVFKTHHSDHQWSQWRLEKEIFNRVKISNNQESGKTGEKKGSHIIVIIPKKVKDKISEKSLEEYFSSYGEIKKAFVLRNEATMESKGCGVVTFKDSCVAEEIFADDKHKIDGVEVYVKKSLLDDE